MSDFPKEGIRPQYSRGRSRGVPPLQPAAGSASPGAPVAQMESLELGLASTSRGGRSPGSGSPTDSRFGAGSDGEREGNGHGNGNGNGGTSPPGQRGTPRGRMMRSDYIASRPPGLSKKGTGGDSIRLVCNFFELQRKKGANWRLYKYRVEMSPQEDRIGIIKGIIRNLKQEQDPPAQVNVGDLIGPNIFDGQHMFVSKQIPDEALSFRRLSRQGNEYQLQLTLVEELVPTDPMYIVFYNNVMKEVQKKLELDQMGRHFFDRQQAIQLEHYRLELYPGYITVLRQHENNLLLCVEVTHKVLRMDTVLEVMNGIRRDPNVAREGPDAYINAIHNELVGTIVMTTYNRKTYRVDDVLYDKHPTDKFTYRGEEITFADYFKNKWNVEIGALKQPMLSSNPKQRDIHRGFTEPFILVPELCRMTGLNDSLRSNWKLMKDLGEHLHMVPDRRVDKVSGFIKRIVSNAKVSNELLGWGLRFKTEPIEIQGRVLPREKILFGGGKDFTPDEKADWTNAFRSCPMMSASALKRWVLIVPDRDARDVDNLINTMQRVAKPLNFMIDRPEIQKLRNSSPATYSQAITDIMGKHGGSVQLIFAILPGNQLDRYAAVKRQANVNYGIPSQCFLTKNVSSKGLMSIATKCVIQMNAKLGYEPWSVSIPLNFTMVAGFDVYHSTAGGRRGQTVGALCASTSKNCTQYFSTVSYHNSKEELSNNLCIDFGKCLMAYGKVNGKLPDRILFYRDGVGEGQLGYVYEQELEQLKEAIKKMYVSGGHPSPVFTFIVCTKRINTRIIEMRNNRGNNPPPGTVVDDIITLPERYDFFIVAQFAKQGTVSPTSYNVLYDDSSIGPERLQRLSYKLCHLYFNWSGTVAVPAPCQYAHKLAFLTGTALGSPSHQNLSNLLYYL